MSKIDSKQEAAVADIRQWVTERMRDIRVARGVTQAKLAELMGVHFSRVSDFENNVSGYKATTVFRAARALGVNMEQVFRGAPDFKGKTIGPPVIIVSQERLQQLLMEAGVAEATAKSVVGLVASSASS